VTDAIATETETARIVPGADLMAVAAAILTTTMATITTTLTTTTITGHPDRPDHPGHPDLLTTGQAPQPPRDGHHGPVAAAVHPTDLPMCTAAEPGSALPRTEMKSWTRKLMPEAAALMPEVVVHLLQARPLVATV